MRVLVWCCIVMLVCLVQHSLLAHGRLVPDLPLALAVWAMVDGGEDGVALRAASVGLVRDLIDPGSAWFHTASYLGLALAFLLVRHLVFRSRAAAWAGVALVCSLLVSAIDGLIGGFGDATWASTLALAALTAVAAVPIGWLFSGLPKSLDVVGRGAE